MTWHARYTGPHGIDAVLDSPSWTGAANYLRGLLWAAHPEGIYERAARALQAARPECGFSYSDGRHTLILRDDSMPILPWDQGELFGLAIYRGTPTRWKTLAPSRSIIRPLRHSRARRSSDCGSR